MNRQRIGDVAETLLDYFEHDRTFQTDQILTVPAAGYTDSNQHRAEMDLIFKRLPLMLALTCEMPEPGDYKAMKAAGLPILMARDKAGTVRAFLNVCAHRWAPVAEDGYGNCLRFICPFHGWSYGADGRLIGIASRAKFGDIDASARGLKQLPCEERHGMIFVCLTPGEPLDLDGYYGALLEEHAEAGLEGWTFLGSRVVEGANWKIVLNNFLESYHFASLHSKTVSQTFASNTSHYEGFGPNIRTGLAYLSISKLHDIPRDQWGRREGLEFGFIRIFFPNTTTFLAGESAISPSLFTQILPGPIPRESRLVLLFLSKEPPKDEDARKKIENQINESTSQIVSDEDLAIGIKIQEGLESGAHEGLLYGRNEPANQYFHKWVNWYLRGDPAAAKPVM